jgi:hypothetical protein
MGFCISLIVARGRVAILAPGVRSGKRRRAREAQMIPFDLYSKRQKKLQQAGQVDVYQYDNFPEAFRNQVVHIFASLYKAGLDSVGSEWFKVLDHLHNLFLREKGVMRIGPNNDAYGQCIHYIQNTTDIEGFIDFLDLSFYIFTISSPLFINKQEYSPDDAVAELNHRFREHRIGFQFEGQQLIRVDSQFMHAEIIKPALALLYEPGFQGPQEEFFQAHAHYRKGQGKEAIAEAAKAFESTMKAICDLRGWAYDRSRATAKDLIKALFDQGLLPSYLDQQYQNLRVILESGAPTVRNKTSGHGQGSVPQPVPDYLVSYTLHLVAANIVFLIEAHKAKP